jgi:hypothetical protein
MLCHTPFIRRDNPDETQDSICTMCFLTVCREGRSELQLRAAEQNHRCERPIRFEYAHHEDSQMGTF